MKDLIWCEISEKNLTHNIKSFRRLLDQHQLDSQRLSPQISGGITLLLQTVKANAYGHGLVEASKIFLEAGVDWLGVNAVWEAEKLRVNKITAPILVLGYTPLADLARVVKINISLTVYNLETIKALGKLNRSVKIHIKVETGTNRQGILSEDLPKFIKEIKRFPKIILEGISTHFANIEDTTEHSYARIQIQNFQKIIEEIEYSGVRIPIKHCANSAAVILWPAVYFNMARVGISGYGMWPSEETFISTAMERREKIILKPALTWKTIVVQIKIIPLGAYVGYGCSFQTKRETKIAILPVGYYDGYDRKISNLGHVLICGQKAPVIGRVCMNMIIVDITDISKVKLEDEAVLLGKQKNNEITTEEMAEWIGTINYEVTTRIRDGIVRKVVN